MAERQIWNKLDVWPLTRVLSDLGGTKLSMRTNPLATILESKTAFLLCRLLITFMFWWEGLGFLRTFSVSAPAINVLAVHPVWLMPSITILVLIGGSVLIVLDRCLRLGAAMLAGFTFLTIPLVHNFWAMSGDAALAARRESEEHLAVIGGLLAIAIVAHFQNRSVR